MPVSRSRISPVERTHGTDRTDRTNRLDRTNAGKKQKPPAANQQELLDDLVRRLRSCERCPAMHRPAVSGGAVVSRVISVGQAPGVKEPVLGRPFAWTAGKTLFGWFHRACGMSEAEFRAKIYMAAVCRCFPGKTSAGGDRVPDAGEIANCQDWLTEELAILRPELVIPIGKLAIQRFVSFDKLTDVIGKEMSVTFFGHTFDIVPLPHPSGASPWHRMEPGLTLLNQALRLIVNHQAWRAGMTKPE